MDIPGKLKADLKRIYGAADPLNYIEDVRAETNPDTQQEELVVRLRVPRSCEKYMCGLFVKPLFPDTYPPVPGKYVMEDWALEQARMMDALSRPLGTWKPEQKPIKVSRPKRVFFNGGHTTIIWDDGSKTTVGVAPDETFDEYAGFCAAMVKKVFGSSREAQKFMDKIKIVQKPKKEKK